MEILSEKGPLSPVTSVGALEDLGATEVMGGFLKSLEISGLDGKVPKYFPRMFPNLVELRMSDSTICSSRTRNLHRWCRSLRLLHLGGCKADCWVEFLKLSKLTELKIEDFVRNVPRFPVEWHVGWRFLIDDVDVSHSNLKFLKLGSQSVISEKHSSHKIPVHSQLESSPWRTSLTLSVEDLETFFPNLRVAIFGLDSYSTLPIHDLATSGIGRTLRGGSGPLEVTYAKGKEGWALRGLESRLADALEIMNPENIAKYGIQLVSFTAINCIVSSQSFFGYLDHLDLPDSFLSKTVFFDLHLNCRSLVDIDRNSISRLKGGHLPRLPLNCVDVSGRPHSEPSLLHDKLCAAGMGRVLALAAAVSDKQSLNLTDTQWFDRPGSTHLFEDPKPQVFPRVFLSNDPILVPTASPGLKGLLRNLQRVCEHMMTLLSDTNNGTCIGQLLVFLGRADFSDIREFCASSTGRPFCFGGVNVRLFSPNFTHSYCQ